MRNLHPDLKLGLVLSAAAVLLRLGNPGNLLLTGAIQRFELSASTFGLLTLVGSVGGLAVVAAAIWVDRRHPHSMMAAGALISLLGLIVLSLSSRVAAYAVGLFISGVGYSALSALIFYAIAAKGATRHRGLLIGALGAVFSVPLSISQVLASWPVPIIVISAPFTVAGAALIFLHLPRVYTGNYKSGQALQGETGTPRVWSAFAWATVAYSVADMARTSSDLLHRSEFMTGSIPAFDGPLQPLTTHVLLGFSVLLWGAASDFIAVRRLISLTAIVFILGTGVHWVADELPVSIVGIVATRMASGGLICLPWVLMADMLPTRHFAKLSFLVLFVGGQLAAGVSAFVVFPLYYAERSVPVFSAIAIEGIALAIVATLLPRPRASEEPCPDTET